MDGEMQRTDKWCRLDAFDELAKQVGVAGVDGRDYRRLLALLEARPRKDRLHGFRARHELGGVSDLRCQNYRLGIRRNLGERPIELLAAAAEEPPEQLKFFVLNRGEVFHSLNCSARFRG